MSLFVKICGITDPRAAGSAVSAGADAVGFVFDPSPRQVTAEAARALAADLPGHVLRVAVFRRPSRDDIERVLELFEPDLVQADHDTLTNVDLPTLPVYHEGDSPIPVGGRFLYEGPVSGAGQTVDFEDAARLAEAGGMILAGGLTPRNVGEAVHTVRPLGVDVSSGVEVSPGRKDPGLINEFVAAARAAQERLILA